MIRTAAFVAGGLVAVSIPVSSAPDVNAMAKWTSASVVHYRVVGEFKGK